MSRPRTPSGHTPGPRLAGAPYDAPPALPFTIDRWWKSLVVGMIFTLVPAGIVTAVLWSVSAPVEACLIGIAVVLVVKEGINTVAINRYHEEIAEVIASIDA
ncbi:MAG: hypothetical protein AAF602_00115 [Myxococcota bacterium]